ncbi:hypothetical protein [Polaromonas sp.]|uniref:hypothetical protein n=1 Tax=Polaromonas sp. TaxID=1869339 RepID=UPI00352B133B
MATSKQLRHIATNPHAFAQFSMSGRLPQMVEPKSPLIDLLLKLSPRDRIAIVGLTVDPTLGYNGSRQFHNAEQALRWARPEPEMLQARSWPAESWRLKGFAHKLTLETLLGKASRAPQGIEKRYPALSAARQGAEAPAQDAAGAEPSAESPAP